MEWGKDVKKDWDAKRKHRKTTSMIQPQCGPENVVWSVD